MYILQEVGRDNPRIFPTHTARLHTKGFTFPCNFHVASASGCGLACLRDTTLCTRSPSPVIAAASRSASAMSLSAPSTARLKATRTQVWFHSLSSFHNGSFGRGGAQPRLRQPVFIVRMSAPCSERKARSCAQMRVRACVQVCACVCVCMCE